MSWWILKISFNEKHILAITQAICLYHKEQKIDGSFYPGFDICSLPALAFATTMEVLAANNIELIIDAGNEYTPTLVITHAISQYNAWKNGVGRE